MKRLVVPVIVVTALSHVWVEASRADLAADIKAALADKLLQKAEVGVEVVRLGRAPADAKAIYHRNSTLPLVPASNLKLITTAAALERLGADFRFRTYLVERDGDLILWGDGDPTLGDAELLKKAGWDVTTVFANWAELLKQHSLKHVRHVIVDDGVFDEQFQHPRWPADQEHKRYAAQVGGVNLNANCVDFFVRLNGARQVVNYSTHPRTAYINVRNTCVAGNENAIWLSRQGGTNEVILRGQTNANNEAPVSVTIHDPPMFAATVLAETLIDNGIQMTGEVKRDRSSRAEYDKAGDDQKKRWTVLAVHATPLPVVLARANKDSMNLYAEALCKRLGYEATGQSGSWENGTAAVGSFLKFLGVPESQFRLDDGSGLSKENAISSNAIVRILTHEFHGKHSAAYLASLAVAGQDGTLADRFRGSDLQGRVFAKSGFIAATSAFSGYLKTKSDQWYAFSILINGIPPDTNSGAKQIQEQVVKAIDAHAGGESSASRGRR